MELRQHRYRAVTRPARPAKPQPALPALLCLLLCAVMAFFATMPFGESAHGIYGAAALLKWSIERRQPTRLRLGSD
jgi:citrate/tricarballylate utilization protein